MVLLCFHSGFITVLWPVLWFYGVFLAVRSPPRTRDPRPRPGATNRGPQEPATAADGRTRTDGGTDGRTAGRTDRPTDRP